MHPCYEFMISDITHTYALKSITTMPQHMDQKRNSYAYGFFNCPRYNKSAEKLRIEITYKNYVYYYPVCFYSRGMIRQALIILKADIIMPPYFGFKSTREGIFELHNYFLHTQYKA